MPRAPLTDEQRLAARERLARAREIKAEKSTAVAERPEDTDDLSGALLELAGALKSASSSKARRAEVVGKIEALLNSLDPKEYPDIAKSEVVQRLFDVVVEQKTEQAAQAGQAPGSIVWIKSPQTGMMVAANKVPWHETHLKGFERVTFELAEPRTVIWNGLRRDYSPDVEYTDYRMFYDLVRESRRATQDGEQHAEYLMRKRNTLRDPSIAGVGTAKVRGSADVGTYIPGGGTFEPSFTTALEEEAAE